MIKICVVDDHPVVREGLKRIIAEHPEMAVTGETGDGHEALKLVKAGHFDVILLDITMPTKSGLDLLKELRTESPSLPVLVVTMHAEDQYAMRVLRAGAAGYLTKDAACDQLVKAIRKVIRGGKYISSKLAEKLAYGLDGATTRPPHELLSDREYQVLCMIASGKRVTEIAEKLFLSVKTISTYRVRLLEKLKMKSNAELTRYAIKAGLVD